jgi:hypothetical protein
MVDVLILLSVVAAALGLVPAAIARACSRNFAKWWRGSFTGLFLFGSALTLAHYLPFVVSIRALPGPTVPPGFTPETFAKKMDGCNEFAQITRSGPSASVDDFRERNDYEIVQNCDKAARQAGWVYRESSKTWIKP